jgi:hypothetical protein
MELKSLLHKATDGIKLLLAQPTMMFNYYDRKEDFIYKKHIVTADEAGRPDLITIDYMGAQSSIDIILKFNGISDPFSIAEGDELLIPFDGIAYFMLDRPSVVDDNMIKQLYMDTKRMPKKDAARMEVLKKKYNKEALLPPNVIPAGQKAYQFLPNGEVQFGAVAQTAAANTSNTPNTAGVGNNNPIATTQTTAAANRDAGKVDRINKSEIEAYLDKNSKDGGKADSKGTNINKGDNPTGDASTNSPGGKCN